MGFLGSDTHFANVPLPPIIYVPRRNQETSLGPSFPTCLHLCPQLSNARLHQEGAAVAGTAQLLTGWGSRYSRTVELEGGASAWPPSSHQHPPRASGPTSSETPALLLTRGRQC